MKNNLLTQAKGVNYSTKVMYDISRRNQMIESQGQPLGSPAPVSAHYQPASGSWGETFPLLIHRRGEIAMLFEF